MTDATPEIFDVIASGAVEIPDESNIETVAGGWRMIDAFDAQMQSMEPADYSHVHRFTPGLYIREIFMPAGMLCTSLVHKTEHPFVISQGTVSVFIPGKGVERFTAPYCGITKPGTRRLLYCHTDVVWTTFHPTDLTDLAEIEAAIIEPYHNPLLAMPVAQIESEVS